MSEAESYQYDALRTAVPGWCMMARRLKLLLLTAACVTAAGGCRLLQNDHSNGFDPYDKDPGPTWSGATVPQQPTDTRKEIDEERARRQTDFLRSNLAPRR